MSTVRPERHAQESAVFASHHEPGVRAVRDWLHSCADDCNRRWPDAVGEEIPRMQGEAKMIARLLKLIERGPLVQPGGAQ